MIVIIIKAFSRQRPRVGPPLAPAAQLVFNTRGAAVTFAPSTKAIAESGYADCGNPFPDRVLSYRGTNGLYGRADLAGLNLARYPSVLIELGNMKNTAEAAVLASAEGRSRYASAVTQGIAAYLGSTTLARL